MNITLAADVLDEPVSVLEAKAYLSLASDFTDDDALIAGLISAARGQGENAAGREFARKQWTLALDRFPNSWPWPFVSRVSYPIADTSSSTVYEFAMSRSEIRLLDPLVSVDTFSYRKSDGSTVTMVENTDYIVDVFKHPGVVAPMFGQTWPTDDMWPSSAVQLTFTSGYTADTCPSDYKQGIHFLVSQWYEARLPFEAIRFVAEMPFSVTSLFTSDKLWRF